MLRFQAAFFRRATRTKTALLPFVRSCRLSFLERVVKAIESSLCNFNDFSYLLNYILKDAITLQAGERAVL